MKDLRAIDLFAGAGGFSTGAQLAGVRVVWAANHWQAAVDVHRANHPDVEHVCQDLHQADWSRVPAHELLLASPCCQGHSRARGSDRPQHDASRSTAWAVVSAAEFHRPPIVLVENVPEFEKWPLYPAWSQAMKALGYTLSSHVLDAADLGVPQNRRRLFIVGVQSSSDLQLTWPKAQIAAASGFIQLDQGRWSQVDRPGRAQSTLERVQAGRREHGDTFLISYYGNTRTGRSINRPIGTITTRDRWAIVAGDRMRMLNIEEARDAMSFPASYQLPRNGRLAMHMLGNAVPPRMAAGVIDAVRKAVAV